VTSAPFCYRLWSDNCSPTLWVTSSDVRPVRRFALFALVAACGGGGNGEAEDAAPSTTATSEPTTTITTAATSTTTAPAATTSSVKVRTLREWRSPTGNIVCGSGKFGVGCTIEQREWTPPRTEPCPGMWSLFLGTDGTADFTCETTNPVIDPPVLSYGEASYVGDVECVSRQDGMTCSHRPTGHGFFVSRQSYRLF
jgi:hypothetical protein